MKILHAVIYSLKYTSLFLLFFFFFFFSLHIVDSLSSSSGFQFYRHSVCALVFLWSMCVSFKSICLLYFVMRPHIMLEFFFCRNCVFLIWHLTYFYVILKCWIIVSCPVLAVNRLLSWAENNSGNDWWGSNNIKILTYCLNILTYLYVCLYNFFLYA